MAKQGLLKLEELGIPFRRPEDYFAEMVKSDQHIQKVSYQRSTNFFHSLLFLGGCIFHLPPVPACAQANPNVHVLVCEILHVPVLLQVGGVLMYRDVCLGGPVCAQTNYSHVYALVCTQQCVPVFVCCSWWCVDVSGCVHQCSLSC